MAKDDTTAATPPSLQYTSRFDKWDSQAWVRSGERRLAPFEEGLEFYSAGVSVLFTHPAIREAPPATQSRLLTLQLYNYLEFTVWLEMGPVNEACDWIRRPDFLPWLPQEMKGDALKIYTDEAGHAQMSYQLKREVEERTGITSVRHRPAFLATLDKLVSLEEPAWTPIIKLLFVVVSETLITGTLNRLPYDDTVQRAVRDLAADHAHDEGRHHVFFRDLFYYLWPRLPEAVKTRLGPLLPEMVLAFLKPDASELSEILRACDGAFPMSGRIVSELVEGEATRIAIAAAADPSMKIFSKAGVLANPASAAAFRGRGLLDVTNLRARAR